MKLQTRPIFNMDENPRLDRVVDASLRERGVRASFATPGSGPVWDERHFDLSECKAFRALAGDDQRSLLTRLSDHLLTEAFYIESAGMSYAAKMNLMAESLDEKIFFCQMAEEEARHFQMLRPWFPVSLRQTAVPAFAEVVGQIVEDCDRQEGLFLIQVLLEGWGLFYYRGLAATATVPEVQRAFETILFDETRHHSAGVIILKEGGEDLRRSERIEHTLRSILNMVRVGPVTLINELMTESGGLTRGRILDSLAEVHAMRGAGLKLERLKGLMERVLPAGMLEFCETEDLFRPLSESAMAQVIEDLNQKNVLREVGR